MDARVLLVGGPSSVAMLWMDDLVEAGAKVNAVANGADALRHLELLAPDVIIMDVHLPGQLDGFDTCRAIRSRSEAIVVFATTVPGPFDEVVGLAVGGDHFLSGDTSAPIVVARLKSLLRRSRGALRPDVKDAESASGNGVGWERPGLSPGEERVTEGDLVIDAVAREVWVKGEQVPLTRIEFDLLLTLARCPRRVFTREQLMLGVWGETSDGSHVLDTHVSRLRRKIDDAGGERVAYAIRGVGFRLRG
jgi:DNA-binding response OmpR family regulator